MSIPRGQKCQETIGMIGEFYIRCGEPAIMLIKHRGRAEGPYYMCFFCGCHNVDNRNAEVLATNNLDVAKRYNLEVADGPLEDQAPSTLE